ncbi:hypothetical protein DIC66_09390 [Rhodoferax lacus]|uniref:Uncharacterized protein n=1 Tax=Rhodoferax lacus TaxID=2184758 RepID=A0A3E1RD87_9BURK|nr:hypothetical protein [Rhodoferax lacus]RFO97328.1 hypothetical protein DIC66_09390 [Rhodoferax lacus]
MKPAFPRPAWLLVATALLWAWAPQVQAWELSGRKTLSALTRDQQVLPIGHVDFTPQADGRTAFTLSVDHQRFVDHFLSMKEFKCLQGPDEVLCHVPYPYTNPGTVSGNDYAWLEHQLLFLFKQPRDFGAKLWNGLYFRLEPDGEGLVGLPQAVDLNLISAPPDDLLTPPYAPGQRDDLPPGAHWIARLHIR